MPKNPFKIKEMRGLWDLLFHKPPMLKNGVRSVGNSFHSSFWHGYDGLYCAHIPRIVGHGPAIVLVKTVNVTKPQTRRKVMKKLFLVSLMLMVASACFAGADIKEFSVVNSSPAEFKLSNENPEVEVERNAQEESGLLDKEFCAFGYYAGEVEIFQKSMNIKEFYEIVDRLSVIFKMVAKDEHIGVIVRPNGVISSIIVNGKAGDKAWMEEFSKKVNALIKNSFA